MFAIPGEDKHHRSGIYFRESNLMKKSSWQTRISLNWDDMFPVHYITSLNIFNLKKPCFLYVSYKLQRHYWDDIYRGPACCFPSPLSQAHHLAARTCVLIVDSLGASGRDETLWIAVIVHSWLQHALELERRPGMRSRVTRNLKCLPLNKRQKSIQLGLDFK